jgi:hypothetical protein
VVEESDVVEIAAPEQKRFRFSEWRRSPYGRQESSSLPGRTDVVIFFVAEGKIIWR